MEARDEMQAHIMKRGQNSKTFYQVAKAWANPLLDARAIIVILMGTTT
jgi:small subunit ribosomal protein S16